MLCELIGSARGRGMHVPDRRPVLRNSAEIVGKTLVEQSLTIPHFTKSVEEIASARIRYVRYSTMQTSSSRILRSPSSLLVVRSIRYFTIAQCLQECCSGSMIILAHPEQGSPAKKRTKEAVPMESLFTFPYLCSLLEQLISFRQQAHVHGRLPQLHDGYPIIAGRFTCLGEEFILYGHLRLGVT